MKKQIEETLQCLVGQSFWGSGRVANLLTFQFGPRHVRISVGNGKLVEVGTYALHVQCAWRLVSRRSIIAASGDRLYEPTEASEKMKHYEGEDYAWPEKNLSFLDERLYFFFQEREQKPAIVQTVQADDLGGLILEMSNDLTLTVFPDDSFDEEYWRFFQPDVKQPHFVVTGAGIEDPEEEGEEEE